MIKKIKIIVILIISLMFLGCTTTSENIINSTDDKEKLSPVNYLNITSSRAYTDNVAWAHVVFNMKNEGARDIEMLRVQISIWDKNDNLLSSKTLYPSPYPDWGLPAGESFSYETRFRPSESNGFERYSIKVVNGRWA